MRLIILIAAIVALPLSAATVTVTNLNDAGAGSLRDAVSSASTGDDIVFDSSLGGGTVTLTTGEIATGAKALTITGLTDAGGKPNLTISGNDASRILDAGDNLSVSNLRFMDGNAGLSRGGAIRNNGLSSISCNNCVFESNRTTGDQSGALDGDISNLTDCSFISNSTPMNWAGGAVSLIGSASSTTTILRCTFSGNSSGRGGAIYVEGSGTRTINITNSTFSGNQAMATASGGGGAIAVDTDGTVTVNATHSTFSGNTSALTTDGQCVWLRANNSIGPATAQFMAASSIFTDSSADVMFAPGGGGGTEIFTSADFNVCSDAPAWMTGAADQTTTDPLLAALADNGGLTQTHAITASSPAYNAGNPAGSVTTDQRTLNRDATPDAGSFEVQPTSSGGGGGGDDDESCSTGGHQTWLWLMILGLVAAAVLRPRRI